MTITIELYATFLLILRLASMTFIGLVLHRQAELFKIKLIPSINHYRQVLFQLALVIFIGNMIPAIIDLLTIFDGLGRSASVVHTVSLVYSMAWSLTSLASTVLIWKLYQMSKLADRQMSESEHTLTNDEI